MDKTYSKTLAYIAGALTLLGLLAFVAALFSIATPAHAQVTLDAAGYNYPSAPPRLEADGAVEVPWGNWLSEIISALSIAAGAVVLWALRKLPSTVVTALDMFAGMMGQGRANELLEKAVTYGINTTAGAVRGKVLTVKVGNEVLERAFEYALRHAPNLVKKLGGIAQLREKIIARLDLVEEAAIPAPRPPAESLVQEAPAPAAP